MSEKKTYHFISHTHWDREWYLPFERFRYRLVNLIDRLLDLLDNNEDFKYFHLDGQTIVLEDYYELRPGNKERLENYIKQGRILIGPWFQQNDLFLTSAESTVRNLIEGINSSRKLGGEMKVGYLPDHFGLLGQMPQIFQGVGIDNCVFGRGYDVSKHKNPLFYWQSPDGTKVSAHLMYHWYNSAQRLPNNKEQLKSVFDGMRNREERINPSNHYPMMNGVDHLEAQYDLPEVLDSLREMYGDEINIVHDTLPDYVEASQQYMNKQGEGALETVNGELREGADYSILAGTLSSRIYNKKANVECHDLVEKWIEPLSVWCKSLGLDQYETDTIRYYWKLYMENHPHDSICGCSQDEVHDHMMDRYQRLKELAFELIDQKLTVLAKQISDEQFDIDDQKLVVVNTSQVKSNGVQQTSIYFLAEDDIKQFTIEDENGNTVPYRIVNESPSRIAVFSPVNLPGDVRVKRVDIEWQPKAETLGYATYRIRPNVQGEVVKDLQTKTETPVLENELLKVELQANGSYHIHNKKTGQVVLNQGRIEECGDRGNLYVFTKVEGEKPQVWDSPVEFVSHTKNELYDECVYRFTWELPESLDNTKEKRTANTVPCEFLVTLRLDKDASQIKMTVDFDNQAKDHRVRVLFPSDTPVKHVLAGGQFDVVQRIWNKGDEWNRDANSEPFWKWVAPVYDDHALAIFAKGVHEYEIVDEGRTAGVTIVRGAENIHVREKVYQEQDYQPKGQCLGKNVVELAVRPFADETSTQLYQEAELFHQGVKTKLYPIDQDRWAVGRPWVQDTMHKGLFKMDDPNENKPKLPLSDTLMEVDGEAMISAIKWSEDGESPVVRLYNVEEKSSNVTLESDFNTNTVATTNLLEEVQEEHTVVDGKVAIDLPKKKITTIKF